MCDYHDVQMRDEYLHCYFDSCRVYRDAGAAWKQAVQLHDREMFVEYGIVEVNLGAQYPTLESQQPAKPAAPSAQRKSGSRRRHSRVQKRINTLTRRVHELQWQLHTATRTLEDVRREKAQQKALIIAELEKVLAAHR
jgi:uncharacterized protein YlxW (UPF0749 family)